MGSFGGWSGSSIVRKRMQCHDSPETLPAHPAGQEHIGMYDELWVIMYWLFLCGPAALGAWALWWEYRCSE